MKKIVIAALMLTLIPVTATYAQESKKPVTARTDEQMAEDAASERAYKNAIEGTRTKGEVAPVKVDPWQTVRPAANATTKR